MKADQTPLDLLLTHIVSLWYDHKKYRLGRVLTVIDASFPDQEQRKAVKDLIHECFGWGNIGTKEFHLEEIQSRIKAFVEGKEFNYDSQSTVRGK